MNDVACYKCKQPLELVGLDNISRSEECPHCYANVRCCMMCVFYDVSAYNECRETSADRHLDKEKANFCGHYKLDQSAKYESEKNNALATANALFKK